jgi:hypothetical protein
MILKELITLLVKIHSVHPEADDAQVWIGKKGPVKFVGLDKRHKPLRVKLEDK